VQGADPERSASKTQRSWSGTPLANAVAEGSDHELEEGQVPVTFAALAGGLFVLLVVAALLVVQSKLAWRAPEHDSRYLADRSDPIRAFAQGALAAYRGNVGDPGFLKQSDALA
jgi:hypothetical protein